MFVWGSKSGVLDLGPQGSKHCPSCEKERNFRLVLQYKMRHLWHLIKWVPEKQYGLVCEVCQRGDKLATQAVEAKIGRPKIPSESSRVLLLVVAVFAVMIAWGFMGRSERAERTEAFLAAPQKSDVYVFDVTTLVKEPSMLGRYGLLRVRNVDGERVEFDTPKFVYENLGGPDADLRNGRYTEPAYFSGNPLVLSRAELAAMKKRGTLVRIERQ